MNSNEKTQLEAATFRRLVAHLQKNKDLQNIDLMNLAGFCRNCLSKWMAEESKLMNQEIEYEVCRQEIYGMPYTEWKKKHQTPID